jgi:tetratricopeptide (TPR) repeat protein
MWIKGKMVLISTKRAQFPLLQIVLSLALIFLLFGHANAVPDLLKDIANEADTAYKDGKYDQAITLYLNITDSGFSSGPLLYNLGNAYFKSGRLGESILMYERAARLMPHNNDVRHNLEFVRERAVDRVDPPPRLFIWTWIDTLRDLFPPAAVAASAWIISVLLTLSLSMLMNMNGHQVRPALQSITWAFAVLFVLNLSLVGLRAQADGSDPSAIIMMDKIEVRSGPDRSSKEVFALHEGTKVGVVQMLEGWTEIRLADGRQGWVPYSSFEVI